MIKPEQVPDAAVYAMSTRHNYLYSDKFIRSLIAEAINAWPSGVLLLGYEYGVADVIQLPLQEASSNE